MTNRMHDLQNPPKSKGRSPEISLKQLKYFVAVAETGQILTASQRVNISPSAITDSIKSLEASLETSLLSRHHKGMTLTHEGQQFLSHASSILNQVDQTLNLYKNPAVGISDNLTVSTTVSVMGYFLPTPLSRFMHSHPNVEIKLIEQGRSSLEKSIQRGESDIGIAITSNIVNDDRYVIETLFQSGRSLWCSAQHPFANLDEVSLQQVCEHPYIQLKLDEAHRNTREFWSQHGVLPKKIIKTASVEGVRSLVANEQGLTILSGLLFRPWSLDGGRLQSRPITEMIPSMNVGMVWNKSREIRPALKSFIDFFKQEFSVRKV
ncbi:MAG: DNA-binding transcriptional LysR family regulator [Gammaproteobacteria bacterium]|jgi:DNA-binding transcriptional LysR family regulator